MIVASLVWFEFIKICSSSYRPLGVSCYVTAQGLGVELNLAKEKYKLINKRVIFIYFPRVIPSFTQIESFQILSESSLGIKNSVY